MEKKIDITRRYCIELQEIENRLSDLEQRRVYEISGAKMDGYITTNAQKLKKLIKDLIQKIEYELPSNEEKLGM